MAHYDSETKKLAKRLSTVTAEDLLDENFRRKVIESSLEIRDLESKLKMAYILKERKQQIDHMEVLRNHEKEMTVLEREEAEQQLKLDQEVEERKMLYEKWKKRRYCRELVEQAAMYRSMKLSQQAEERELDEIHLQRILRAEIRRERREREDRERKKRRLAEELRQCIRLQEQWRAIQRFIEAEEDRLIEECVAQRRRLSQMQQDERRAKAEVLANIRQKLQKALEMEEKRRKEREEIWVEFGCEEKEVAEERKAEEEQKILRELKSGWKRDMEQQMEELRKKKLIEQEEAQYERLWMLEQAEIAAQKDREEAEEKRKDRIKKVEEQAVLLEEKRKLQKAEAEEKALEMRLEEERQAAEDRAIAEERRRILEQHAPLLVGFLPRGVFRSHEEVEALPEAVRPQFRKLVRIQDDPDLW